MSMRISQPLNDFFEAEERNTRQAVANGDLDVGFPLTLGTALDSLEQAPEDIQLLWMAEDRGPVVSDQGAADQWYTAFNTLLELTGLIALHGPDASLYDFMGED